MAQTEKPTQLGYGELGRFVAGELATCVKSIVGLTGACTAAEASTFLNPGGATKLAANGFTLVNAATVAATDTSVTDDTVQVNHVFTCATAAQSVSGFAIENDDDDVVYMECCFNAAISAEIGDTITIVAKMQFKLGA